MIAQTLTLLLLAAVAAGSNHTEDKPQPRPDPNTLTCDPTGQEFLLLPHFTECHKFFMCAHGEEVEFSCSPQLIFDYEMQGCNWHWATTCKLRDPKEDIEDIEGSGEDDLEDGFSARLSPSKVHQFHSILNCNRADSASRLVPYKTDCQRYWRCANGVPQSFYCSDGLFFNERSQQCDFESNVKCTVETEDELKGEYIVYQ